LMISDNVEFLPPIFYAVFWQPFWKWQTSRKGLGSLTTKIGPIFCRKINSHCLSNLCYILLGHTSHFLKLIVCHFLLVCAL
jgi:hypothetical protein